MPYGFGHILSIVWTGRWSSLCLDLQSYQLAIIRASMSSTNLLLRTQYRLTQSVYTCYVECTMMSMPSPSTPSEVIGHCQKGTARPCQSNVRMSSYLVCTVHTYIPTYLHTGTGTGDGVRGRGRGTGDGKLGNLSACSNENEA